MVNITIYQRDNHKIGFQMKGHAGYKESGKDIYCAAISVLAINTANSLEELADAKLSINQDDGYLKLLLINDPNEKTDLLFDSLVLGLKGILEDNGKKFLKVNFEEV